MTAATPQTPRPRLALIAAVARNGVIGGDNQLLWHLPEDMAHFRSATRGCPVLMGRKTWDSLPPKFRPLPGRRNIVLTRQAGWQAEGAERAADLDAALHLVADAARVFVIGGAQIYAAALPLADELLLTELDADFDGDTRFPDWPREAFAARQREHFAPAGERRFAFDIVHYQRAATPA